MKPVSYNLVQQQPGESFASHQSSPPSFANREVSEANNQSNNCSITTPQTTSPATTPIVESVTPRRRAKTNTREENLQIVAAIERGDLEELERFHRAGFNITLTIHGGPITFFNPFAHAATVNNKELFSFLLQKSGIPETRHKFDTLVSFLIDNDQPEFLELLEKFNMLSDNYDIDHTLRFPMINIAIIKDSPRVISWLLGKKIDLTIKSTHPNFSVRGKHNAFDLAISKKNLTLLHDLMVYFTNTNGNFIPLTKARWLKGLMNDCNMDGLESFICSLEKLQNFPEIVKFMVEEASKNNKFEFLELLNRRYGEKFFKRWNIWEQPQEKVFHYLKSISASPEANNSIDHLQTLIKDNVPDSKKIDWFLEKSFQELRDWPAFLAQPEKYCDVLSLIKACINLGATANAEYMLAFAIREGELALFHKSLTTVTKSARRGDAPKNLNSLFQNDTRLVKPKRKKAKTHSTDAMPSTSKHNKTFDDLFTELSRCAVTSGFSMNTITMISTLIDNGANPQCILDRLMKRKYCTAMISDTDLVLIENLIQRINESAHSGHKANFSSILVDILQCSLPAELAKLFIRYGTDITSSVKTLGGQSIKQMVIERMTYCKRADHPEAAYWQDILTYMEESAELCQTAVQQLTPMEQDN